ncbi:hypothetical protein ACLOJK_016316 [Asimina triloba]
MIFENLKTPLNGASLAFPPSSQNPLYATPGRLWLPVRPLQFNASGLLSCWQVDRWNVLSFDYCNIASCAAAFGHLKLLLLDDFRVVGLLPCAIESDVVGGGVAVIWALIDGCWKGVGWIVVRGRRDGRRRTRAHHRTGRWSIWVRMGVGGKTLKVRQTGGGFVLWSATDLLARGAVIAWASDLGGALEWWGEELVEAAGRGRSVCHGKMEEGRAWRRRKEAYTCVAVATDGSSRRLRCWMASSIRI